MGQRIASEQFVPSPTPRAEGPPITVTPTRRGRADIAAGLGASVAVAAVATLCGRAVPSLGPPIFGVLIGIAVSPLARRHDRALRSGIAFSSKRVLQLAVVLLGTGLSLSQVIHTGARSLPVLLGTLAAALVATALVGRLLGLRNKLRTLVGVGTAICGASAIAATSSVIAAEGSEIAYAVSTIFAFNVIAVLTYPALGHLLGLSPHAFGVWTGTAINDVSSVVAAATTYGHGAAKVAVIVKLTRTLMIIPITATLAVLHARRHANENDGARPNWRRVVPWFIGWFLVAVGLNSAGVIPHAAASGLSSAATDCITIALAAIGLSTAPREMARTGWRPLALGASLWITVGISSLLLQHLTGTA